MTLTPVSITLKDKIGQQLSYGVPIRIWLDHDGHYCDFVDALQQQEHNYQLIVFRGSYLEVMVDIEKCLSTIDPPRTLIYLPYHDEERARNTPLLEALLAGSVLEQPFADLVRQAAIGRCSLEATDAFLKREKLTLGDADAWLGEQLRENQGEFSSSLHNLSFDTLIQDILHPKESFHILHFLCTEEHMQTFWRYIEMKTGMAKDWPMRVNFEKHFAQTRQINVDGLIYSFASWALCVEFVFDLGKVTLSAAWNKILSLDSELHRNCCDITRYLRDNKPTLYQNIADETEARDFFSEMRNIEVSKLGKIDSFRFEEDLLFLAALQEALRGNFDQAFEWAHARLEGNSFWVRISDVRRWSWELLKGASQLGVTLEKAPASLGNMNSLGEAADFYAQKCAIVDQHHRYLEQLRYRLLKSSLPEFERLQQLLDLMRKRHREWMNKLAVDFNRLCQEHNFLPADNYQQRLIFLQVLKPLTEQGKVAFFMVDAFRYEMALELKELMNLTAQDEFKLSTRLAELPTNTYIGMNLLAPSLKDNMVELVMRENKITCVQGTGSYQIKDPQTRRTAIKDAIGGQTSPDIDIAEILETDAGILRKKFSHSKIAVVPYWDIDRAGEEGVGPQKFSECLKVLRAAWKKLREVGFTRFLFVADHGFLLVDPLALTKKKHGRNCDNNRRHIITDVAATHLGEVRVRLRDLNYKIEKDLHLVMPKDASLFESGSKNKVFAHGGNSLQERVIPVLEVTHPQKQETTNTRYKISVNSDTKGANTYLTLGVTCEDSQLFSTLEDTIEVEILPVDEPEVQLQMQHAFGGGQYANETLTIEEGKSLSVVLTLEGMSERATRLQIRLPHIEAEPFITQEFFPVTNVQVGVPFPQKKTKETYAWLENIEDPNAKKILTYLADHPSITQEEAAKLLDGKSTARAFRKFRQRLEEYSKKIPFSINIENNGGITRLVRR